MTIKLYNEETVIHTNQTKGKEAYVFRCMKDSIQKNVTIDFENVIRSMAEGKYDIIDIWFGTHNVGEIFPKPTFLPPAVSEELDLVYIGLLNEEIVTAAKTIDDILLDFTKNKEIGFIQIRNRNKLLGNIFRIKEVISRQILLWGADKNENDQ